MKLSIKNHLLRKASLWIAPVALLSGTTMYAQSYRYYDDEHATRHHQHDEKHNLKAHQREERYCEGNSWELQQHQREERHQLKHHQHDERNYGARYYDNRYRGRRGNYDDNYYRRPY
jgi:hypothetical protein